jgi:tRNA C32,U32 (ribose-2'-O)-methylase TrmJ
MHHIIHFEIRQTMNEYTGKGKKSAYKKKQMKRLISILDEIMSTEGEPRLSAIGRRQLIRHWKRTENERNQTRREKYSILKRFFNSYNPKVMVPEPFIIDE